MLIHAPADFIKTFVGVAKKYRPVKPERNEDYPTKTQLALQLLQEFKDTQNDFKVKAVLAVLCMVERDLWMKPRRYSILGGHSDGMAHTRYYSSLHIEMACSGFF